MRRRLLSGGSMFVLRDHVIAKNFPRLAALTERAMKIEAFASRNIPAGLYRFSTAQISLAAKRLIQLAFPPCLLWHYLQSVIGGRGMHRSPERAICFSSRVSASCDVSVAPLRPHSAPPRGRTLPQQNP
jgi:hypothetical protein